MNITLHALDLSLIILYAGVLLVLGLKARRTPGVQPENYLLGGRRLTLVPFIATLVSTWYGGILGIGEFTYLNGVVTLVIFGLPYYIFAFLYAIFLAARIRREGILTIPDRFRRAYGPRSAIFSAIVVFLLTTPAPYLLMLGVLINLLMGVDLWLALLLGMAFSTVYLWRGGFQAVVRTDVLQFVLMFVGFGLLLGVLMSDQPLGQMWQALPPELRHWRGAGPLEWQVMLVWFLIASWTFVDPGFYQRCAAAHDGRTASRGILLSIGVWFVFDLLTITVGLYAVGQLPDLALISAGPIAAYPLLGAAVLPPGLRGLFFVALLAVIMSTIDSFTFISASTLGRDLAAATTTDPAIERRRIRWGIAATAGLGYVLALSLPSVVQLWYTLGMVLVPGLLAPMMLTFTRRIILSDTMALIVGLAGVLTAGIWQLTPIVIRHLGGEASAYPLGLQPMLPGLLVTLVLVVVFGRFSKSG